jgi:hypothetical protein
VITGTSDGDSGFFDPGPGFSNRISAAINGGGVTVNSISYSNPTHVTLNVSVALAAAPGGRTITITNPDGQSATSSSAVLTVVGSTNSIPPPVIQNIALNNMLVTLTWSSVPGQTYRVQYQPTLGPTNWSDLLPDVTASGVTASGTYNNGGAAQRFYRVQVRP